MRGKIQWPPRWPVIDHAAGLGVGRWVTPAKGKGVSFGVCRFTFRRQTPIFLVVRRFEGENLVGVARVWAVECSGLRCGPRRDGAWRFEGPTSFIAQRRDGEKEQERLPKARILDFCWWSKQRSERVWIRAFRADHGNLSGIRGQGPFGTFGDMDVAKEPPWMGSRRVPKGAWPRMPPANPGSRSTAFRAWPFQQSAVCPASRCPRRARYTHRPLLCPPTGFIAGSRAWARESPKSL